MKKRSNPSEDTGGLFYEEGSIDTNGKVIDVFKDFGFCIKGYRVKNDGAEVLQIAHAEQAEIDIDFQRAPGRWQSVLSTDIIPHQIKYDSAKIRKIGVRSKANSTAYRLWLFW